jgi:hypothetical protein
MGLVNDVCCYIDESWIRHIDGMEILDHIHNENHVLNAQLHLREIKNKKSIFLEGNLPSTRDVSKVTVAALRRPAGKLTPIFSSFSRKSRPPFFDFALKENYNFQKKNKLIKYLRKMPPSNDALRHSGGERRL